MTSMFHHVSRSRARALPRLSLRPTSTTDRQSASDVAGWISRRHQHRRVHPVSSGSQVPTASFCEDKEAPSITAKDFILNETKDRSTLATSGISSATSLWAMDPILHHLLEKLIDYGIPSLFVASIIGIASYSVRSDTKENPLHVKNNPAAELYRDLYDTSEQEDRDPLLPPFLQNWESQQSLPINAGVPKDEYLSITHYNRKLQSYEYSMLVATQSKARAASWYRKVSLQSALERSILAQDQREWNTATIQALEYAESEFLKEYKTLLSELVSLQAQFTASSIDEALQSRGIQKAYGLYNASAAAKNAGSSVKGTNPEDGLSLSEDDHATLVDTKKDDTSTNAPEKLVSSSSTEDDKKATPTKVKEAERNMKIVEMEMAAASSEFLTQLVDIVETELDAVGASLRKELEEEMAKLAFPRGLHTMLLSKRSKKRLVQICKKKDWGAPSPEVLAQVDQAEEAFLDKAETLVDEGEKMASHASKAWTQNFFQRVLSPSLYQLLYPPPRRSSAPAPSKTDSTKETEDHKHVLKSELNPAEVFQLRRKLQTITMKMQSLEAKFVKQVIQAVEPDQAAAIRSTLLGDIAARGSGGLWTALQERPLVSLLQQQDAGASKPRLFVTSFKGDSSASQVVSFREKVTAILRSAQPGDEAFVKLSSPGGTVTGYGSAAGQLMRFKERGIKLTIAVEEVAASGGYMMCCVADHIIASPFAALGSIGVVQEMPNAYERLKREGVEFLTTTAGKYKRTLSPYKKIDPEDIAKEQEQLEAILSMFRDFIGKNRPGLNLDEVATGEVSDFEDCIGDFT